MPLTPATNRCYEASELHIFCYEKSGTLKRKTVNEK